MSLARNTGLKLGRGSHLLYRGRTVIKQGANSKRTQTAAGDGTRTPIQPDARGVPPASALAPPTALEQARQARRALPSLALRELPLFLSRGRIKPTTERGRRTLRRRCSARPWIPPPPRACARPPHSTPRAVSRAAPRPTPTPSRPSPHPGSPAARVSMATSPRRRKKKPRALPGSLPCRARRSKWAMERKVGQDGIGSQQQGRKQETSQSLEGCQALSKAPLAEERDG
ncbi:uncharacterized protein DKFZp434B061-like isoform X1 [Mastomys coucha]|uniref:uncharacterized protein DKFZp434B061-like isoform X1 n=1 Tax=Mastomys coucha TaxID=35658 RepID=UPI0012626CB7|nr:uncharacterized protein DKFZp434B061-like isoform X1 [Mastomys coucha]